MLMVTLKTQSFGVVSLNLLGRWLPMWMMIFSQTGTELSLGHWWRQYELCVSHSDLRSHHSDSLSGTWPHPPHVPTCTVHITQAYWVVPGPPPHPHVPTCTVHVTQAYWVVPSPPPHPHVPTCTLQATHTWTKVMCSLLSLKQGTQYD